MKYLLLLLLLAGCGGTRDNLNDPWAVEKVSNCQWYYNYGACDVLFKDGRYGVLSKYDRY